MWLASLGGVTTAGQERGGGGACPVPLGLSVLICRGDLGTEGTMRWRLTLMMVAMRCDLLSAWAATPLAAPMAALAAAPSCSRVGAGVLCRAERSSSSRRAGDAVSTAAVAAPSLDMTPVRLSPWVALCGAFRSSSFGEFMSYVRREQGDAVLLDLWPVLPPTYVLMGKEANRGVLSELDPSLEQS
jgi:hypothetical protein